MSKYDIFDRELPKKFMEGLASEKNIKTLEIRMAHKKMSVGNKVHSDDQGLIHQLQFFLELLQKIFGNLWIGPPSLEASIKPKQILSLKMFLRRDGGNEAIVIPA